MKGIDVEVPRGKFTVITGVSGFQPTRVSVATSGPSIGILSTNTFTTARLAVLA